MEKRFRDERTQWKARLEAISSEREGVLLSGRETFEEKSVQIQQLEEQLRSQAVAHENRRRELVHQATLKSRTLQDVIRHIEQELVSAEELLPRELKERDTVIEGLKGELAALQDKYQRTLARFERARSLTLERRGHEKEESLKKALSAAQEEWAKKLSWPRF